jgi:hypothetical protein
MNPHERELPKDKTDLSSVPGADFFYHLLILRASRTREIPKFDNGDRCLRVPGHVAVPAHQARAKCLGGGRLNRGKFSVPGKEIECRCAYRQRKKAHHKLSLHPRECRSAFDRRGRLAKVQNGESEEGGNRQG